ncbi:response regulator receiver protein [Dissulfuribacter thermophilus]|uniref:Response regulator receiver protein n=1 Tax=Dissulfuribacter thermophilus TaxID=1156395 RepID=A0A1B9F9F2_9BACT|nr:HD domain-containing phosphohydrolase [Dissulfuribacter thermophilus]OCC16513.1 response regulator receiver protein [Dissulfuribacter thermophilus]
MSGEHSDTILFVDDEENILKAIYRLLRKEGYEIVTTTDPFEALDIVREKHVSVIVSDQRMPTMAGTELLEKVKEISPDTVRIILTGYADMNAALDAINKGGVYRFINKPWNDEDFKATLRQAAFQHYLITENKRLMKVTQEQNKKLQELNSQLEKKVLERTEQLRKKHDQLKKLYHRLQINFRDTVRVFMELIELFDTFLGGHSKRVATLSRNLAERMNISGVDLDLIEIAGALHDIGLIGMPKEIFRSSYEKLSSAQKALFRAHPEIGYSLLYKIEFLRQVAVVVRSHHERFDGKGFPDKLPNVSIPIGARIVSVVSAYDMYKYRDKFDKDKALKFLRKDAGTFFDPTVVKAFEDTLHTISPLKGEMALSLDELKEGMRLAREIKTASGRVLMAKDSVLTQGHIVRLKKFHLVDPIVDRIYVYYQP